jgi:hypothetical protein
VSDRALDRSRLRQEWNTTYIDDALTQLREHGYPVKDEDVARLSSFVCKHINIHGRYSFCKYDSAVVRAPCATPVLTFDDQDGE